MKILLAIIFLFMVLVFGFFGLWSFVMGINGYTKMLIPGILLLVTTIALPVIYYKAVFKK